MPKATSIGKPLQQALPHAPLLPGQAPGGPRDPLLQIRVPGPKIPAPLQSFDGMSACGLDPPDTNGVIGPNHYIQTVNVCYEIWDRHNLNSPVGPTSFTSLFAANPATGTPCDNGFTSDPVVLYDPLADRFVLTILAFAGFKPSPPNPPQTPIPPFYECIAVSKTNDPINGGWYKYALLADNNDLNDYPKLGVWPDAYYMSANMNGCCGGSDFVRAWALDRNSILSGGTLNEQHFDVQSGYDSLLPANLHGTSPPSGEPNVFAAVDYNNNNKLFLWNFHVDWSVPANSTFGVGGGHTPNNTVSVASYTHLSQAIPEPGPFPAGPPATTAVYLDPLGDRAMAQAQYRRVGGAESLWVNHAVDTGSNLAGVRWYEVHDPSGAPSLFQQGTFNNGGDGIHRWMGSMAADRFDNMAIVYNVSNSSTKPGIRYAGRLSSDAAGILGQGEGTLFDGTGNQVNCTPDFNHGQTTCTTRWGDYSGMSVDPVDDCTFWATGEYGTGNSFKTRIGSFRLPGCDADVTVSKTGPASIIAGTDLTYNLIVTNNGPVTAEDVALNDAIPGNTTYVSWIQNTGPAFSCTTPSGGTGTVNCSIASMAKGAAATFTLIVHVSPSAPNGSSVSNTATVTTTSNDPNLSNNMATATTTVLTSADLRVTKSAAVDPIVAGTAETYNLTVTNNGPSDAQNVTLVDAIPTHTTFSSFVQNTGTAFTCTTPPSGGTGSVSCTLATLPAGAAATFSFVVHVSPSAPDGSTLSNTASVSSNTTDPNPANNSTTVMTAVIARADLSLSKSQTSNLVIADTDQTYHFAVVNNGPSDAQSVTLSDPAPANTTFVSLIQNTGPAFACSTPPAGGIGNVSCTIAALAAGASASFTMVVRISPIDSSSITNIASAASTTVDPDPANNAATVTARDSIDEYKQNVLTDLTALRSTVTDKQIGRKLDKAIQDLSNSLDPSLWVDGNLLEPKHGDEVFTEEKDAVVFMSDLIRSNAGGLASALQDLVGRLLAADHALADIAINHVISAGGAPNLIALAQDQLARGGGTASNNIVAIEHDRNAWQHAQQATQR